MTILIFLTHPFVFFFYKFFIVKFRVTLIFSLLLKCTSQNPLSTRLLSLFLSHQTPFYVIDIAYFLVTAVKFDQVFVLKFDQVFVLKFGWVLLCHLSPWSISLICAQIEAYRWFVHCWAIGGAISPFNDHRVLIF